MKLKTLFANIADAIREKDGTKLPITASEFPERILKISGPISIVTPELDYNTREEVIAGSFFNGDPIYRQCFTGYGNSFTLPAIKDATAYLSIYGFCGSYNSGNRTFVVPWRNNNNYGYLTSDSDGVITFTSNHSPGITTCHVFVEYLKTEVGLNGV